MKLHKLTDTSALTEKMPVLFVGHGSPMNAIEENQFVKGFRNVAAEIPIPKAILCISAHWETSGTYVTAMNNPATIHDFSGFPRELFEVEYPAPGDPGLAKKTREMLTKAEVGLNYDWGLDHGAWSVIRHMYPDANIPVIQMSLDFKKSPKSHYEMAAQLSMLRKKGVLIMGSGNIVHNLGRIAWDKINADYGFDWALEANKKIKDLILNNDHYALVNFSKQGKAFDLSVPTAEHYLPLLYVLALQERDESVSFFNDKVIGGSLSMTSVKIINNQLVTDNL
jgi:4,5-DOPA dioxygenase extradiol